MSRRNMMLMTGAAAGILAADYYFPIISTAAENFSNSNTVEKNILIQESLAAGTNFLYKQFDQNRGLLKASEITEAEVCYLMTDNYLALLALSKIGDQGGLIPTISKSLSDFNPPRHGVIEILAGETVTWPPHGSDTYHYENNVKSESRPEHNDVMLDWQQYADLGMYGAILASNMGDYDGAVRQYQETMQMWTPNGFADIVHKKDPKNLFTNYKTALALITEKTLGFEPDQAKIELLLKMQNGNGGFVSMSELANEIRPIGDANVETTSLSLLALSD